LDRDVITDYFPGAFPRERAGELLVECYKALGLSPRSTVVFRDILPSNDPADPVALAEARGFFARCGRELLVEFGAISVDEYLENENGKKNVVLVGHV
jgi:hypothetical protein